MVNYSVDEINGVCKCIIVVKKKSNGKTYTYAFKGKSQCSPEDTFNAKFGKNLAHIRAMIKHKKWEQKGYKASIDFCHNATQYYTEQGDKMKDRLNKTNQNLNRLEGELNDLLKFD